MEREPQDLEIDAGEAKPPGTALARLKSVSLALSEAARRQRLSQRRAARLTSGGFENRRGAALVRALLGVSFAAFVILPTLTAAIYFGLIAADQYVAEAEFTVSAGESPYRDGIASMTGLPSQLIIQDTQILANFIHSREMADRLEAKVGLRRLYADPRADWLARFDADMPVERFVKYWRKVARVSIKMPGGIIKFSVRAFSAQDAKRIAEAGLEICEELVNSLNARMNHDAVALAETGFQHASERLARTLAAQEVARNESGILETKASAQAVTALIGQLRSALLSASGAYETQSKYMNADTAQMRDLKTRIEVLQVQIAKLEGELTGKPEAAHATVSAAMLKFGALESEQKADLQLYESAAAALEHARIVAENKIIYLKAFVRPSLPQEAEYPARALDVLLVALSSLALWGVGVAVGAVVRNNMA